MFCIFIASSAPYNTGAGNPRLCRRILEKIPESDFAGAHDITFDIEPFNYEIVKNTSKLLFSTYDAPGGFV